MYTHVCIRLTRACAWRVCGAWSSLLKVCMSSMPPMLVYTGASSCVWRVCGVCVVLTRACAWRVYGMWSSLLQGDPALKPGLRRYLTNPVWMMWLQVEPPNPEP